MNFMGDTWNCENEVSGKKLHLVARSESRYREDFGCLLWMQYTEQETKKNTCASMGISRATLEMAPYRFCKSF